MPERQLSVQFLVAKLISEAVNYCQKTVFVIQYQVWAEQQCRALSQKQKWEPEEFQQGEMPNFCNTFNPHEKDDCTEYYEGPYPQMGMS